MPRSILYPEWYDENLVRKYPFSDGATLTNGVDLLPIGVFLDAHLYPLQADDKQYLSKITVEGDQLTLYISDSGNVVCSGTIDILDGGHTIEMTDTYDRPVGVLVVDTDQLALLGTWSLGDHMFPRIGTPFAATVVHPMPTTGVNGFLLSDDTLFAGDVWFVGGEGVVFSEESGVMRVDIAGDPYYIERRCQEVKEEYTEASRFLTSIGGLFPNAVGNISLNPGGNVALDSTLRIIPLDSENGLCVELVGSRMGEHYVQD